jgi:hypothetical protein
MIHLPDFKDSREAIRFGQHITRDQFIFLAGARAGLKREFDEIRHYEASLDSTDRCLAVAFKLQFIRECMEAAPDNVLASLIGTGIVRNGPDPEVREGANFTAGGSERADASESREAGCSFLVKNESPIHSTSQPLNASTSLEAAR